MARGHRLQENQQERIGKSRVLIMVIAALFMLLVLRLAWVQVVEAEINIRLSAENSMQLKPLKAPRGRMFDRDGRMLVRNRPSYAMYVLPYKIKERAMVIDNLLKIRDSSDSRLFDSLGLASRMKSAMSRRFDATRLKEDISMEIVTIVEEHSMEIPGIIVETESRREYTLGDAAFHVLGYMSEVSERQFDSLREHGYLYGDLIGRAGMEKQYETELKGRNGREYIEVNAYGKSLGPIAHMPRSVPQPGFDAYLTLDAELQSRARRVFPDSLRGAVAALDPRNGHVLVLFSSPTVDPNIFSMSATLRNESWKRIKTDRNLPLNNRAVMGTYAPGSTFKLVTALSGLGSGKLTENSVMPRPCTGSFRLGRRTAHCWYLKGHGRLNLVGGVQKSCNVYMYQAGLRLGDRIINHYARLLGLGAATGIDLPQEKDGWLSGEEAYNKRFKARGWKWTRGQLLNMAIGQAQIVTPVQLAAMIGALGNGKFRYTPILLREIRDRNGVVIRQQQPEVAEELRLDPDHVTVMHKAMEAVLKPGGTAARARVAGIRVGGKTGSAENPHGDKTHSLFVACAPLEEPTIAIAVVVENAGHGSAVAAPIAGDIMRYYFNETDRGRRVAERISRLASKRPSR